MFLKSQIKTKYYNLRVFGCQMNKSDAERIETVMEKSGYSPTDDEKKASVVIAVACSVRQSPIDRVYGLSGRWSKLPAKTILTGCVLGFDRVKLAKRFDHILPITEIGKILKGIRHPSTLLRTGEALGMRDDDNKCQYLGIEPKRGSKFQAWVPIKTGCDNYCSYCVVPYTRGREKSRPAEEVVALVRGLIKQGYKEITLLGENVNRYRSKSKIKNKKSKTQIKNEKIIDFPQLLKDLAQIPAKFWIRFVTSHPEDFTDELIKVVAGAEKICNHIHLPIQSGSTAVLKKMNRKYTKSEYVRLIGKIRKTIPDASISTDIIVGFPGETKKQFLETADMMKKVKFGMAYIAQYSPRPGTAAAKMEDDVTREEKKRRERVLMDILKKTSLENNRRLVGETMEVLVVSKKQKDNPSTSSGRGKTKKQFLVGKTEGFKNVRFGGDEKLVGEFVKVKITKASEFGLEGEIIKN